MKRSLKENLLKGGSPSKVMQNVLFGDIFAIWPFKHDACHPRASSSSPLKKKFLQSSQRVNFKRQTNLDWETFDLLSCDVEQQPAQTKAKKKTHTPLCCEIQKDYSALIHPTYGGGIVSLSAG